MSTQRKSSSKNRKVTGRVLFGATRAVPSAPTIPTRWLNNFIGLFLLAPTWIFAQTLFTVFTHTARNDEFWATEEFWFFSLGAVFWTIAFIGSIWVFGEPRPLTPYVFIHELTHAIWARALGGRVFEFKASRNGGYIMTDKANFWIALTPYFWPLCPIPIIAAYGMASLFYDMHPFTPALFGLLGLTWAFHITFTLWMIPKGQTDLSAHGNFFSLVVIILFNILILCGFLIVAAPEVTFTSFGREFARHASVFSEFVLKVFNTGVRHILQRMM